MRGPRDPRDPDRLGGIGQRESGHEVGWGIGKRPNLLSVVVLGFFWRHEPIGGVGIPSRSNRGADHDGSGDLAQLTSDLHEQVDGSTVGVRQPGRGVPKLHRPVATGTPCGGFQDESDLGFTRHSGAS